mgnify:CR=1 FL=1|tara:strand:+ start:66 stop:728 length:663 start_codon:yes stop_codon:yes gene_type:complete
MSFGYSVLGFGSSATHAVVSSSEEITLATTSSGNYNNALKAGFYHFGLGIFTTLEDGSNSVFATATSPTRTTQTFDVDISDLSDANALYATGGTQIIVGGYIRHNGSSISSQEWNTVSAATTSSLSNGVQWVPYETHEDRENTIDNTTMTNLTPQGIYHNANGTDSGSGFYIGALEWGGGRGSVTYPADGDTVTWRIAAEADVDGVSVTTIHDLLLEFVT